MSDARRPEPSDISPPTRAVRSRSRLLLPIGFGILLTALVGLNAWLAWESRPLSDRPTIARAIRLDQLDTAEAALRARLRRSPHEGESRFLLARVLARRHDLLGCAEQLHHVPFWAPEKAEALYLEGESYQNAFHAPGAEAAWSQLIEIDPLHPPPSEFFSNACLNLAKLYLLQNRQEEAVAVIWRLYEAVEPRHHESILGVRFESELNRVRPDQAVVPLRRFVETVPEDGNSRRALALAEQAIGRSEEALRQIEACLSAQPDDPAAHRDRLVILQAQNDFDALAEAVEQLPSGSDLDAHTWSLRGFVRERAGDLEGAAKAYRRAFELDPIDSRSLYRLALLEQRLGRPEIAEPLLERHEPLRAALHELPDAFQEYQAALHGRRFSKGPDREAAITRLIELCEIIGWPREAQAWRNLID
ncbi:hypothetical protein BH23PLA1_BH23PLA1_09570 [soil metagenome]